MYIKNLKLKNYRNYTNLNIDFSSNINVIFGDNAQGKTNILESIFLCASGRSHKTQKFTELVQDGMESNLVMLEVIKNKSSSTIQIELKKNEKKKILINGIQVKKMGNLMGTLIAVFFSPDELKIIKGSPTDRRRFIDITISQFIPRYFYALQQYNKILLYRNVLLKNLSTKKELLSTLDTWNTQLISVGSYIIKVRLDFMKKLSEVSKKKHSILTGDKENLYIQYTPSIAFSTEKEIEKNFYSKLKIYQDMEIKRGQTMVGPQRDDILININNKNLRIYGSQGQQRTSVLSMKLAKIDIISELIGESPVLLLDDVFSELDFERQKFLLETLKDIQTFITCTDKNIDVLNLQKNVNFIQVQNGEIV